MEATGDSESDATPLSDAAYDSDGAESSSEGGGAAGEKPLRCATRRRWLPAEQVAAEYRAAKTNIIGGDETNGSELASTTTTPAERPAAAEKEESNRRFWEACLAHGYS